ncbi:MAG: hypothetical protein ACI9W4_000950 [Rhodothermales bacterium]|jgi:hypothetical protein
MKRLLSLSAACFAISLLVSTALAQSYGVFELARTGLYEAEVISLFQPDYVASLFGVRADAAPYASVGRVDLEAQQLAILGVSGSAMEAKSFDIVVAGSDRDRKNLECPGLAHAAAYPLEMVVRQNGSAVDIEFVDAMYRMKMYFEDAGKWAFMKNMTMPGSIADELKGFIREATTGR